MKYCARFLVLAFFIINLSAHAGVLASKTRLIFNNEESEQSLIVANTNNYPIIVQTWVDNGEGSSAVEVPFIVLPVTFRLEPSQIKTLRIINIGDEKLSSSKQESVFWLNIYEIPPVDSAGQESMNKINLVMNTQYKIFIRPKEFKKYPPDIEKFISFKVVHKNNVWYLACKNLSNFYISVANITFSPDDTHHPIDVEQEMDMMIPPLSEKYYKLSQSASSTTGNITFNYLDDYGAIQTKQIQLT